MSSNSGTGAHFYVTYKHLYFAYINKANLHDIMWSYAMCEIIFSPHLFIIAKMQNLVACIKYKYAQPLYYTILAVMRVSVSYR